MLGSSSVVSARKASRTYACYSYFRSFASGKSHRAPRIPQTKKSESLQRKEVDSGSKDTGLHNVQPRLTALFTPLRYRSNGNPYTREHAYAGIQRLPLAAVLLALMCWDETRPFFAVRFLGPSMLPTMACDGSEVWLSCSTWVLYLWRLRSVLFDNEPLYRKGDIIGFSPPENKSQVSCKRVIGVSGNTVASYGQYVQLYTKQDPIALGRIWPEKSHPLYHLAATRYRQQEEFRTKIEQQINPFHTEVVPERHVWSESDCPGLGLDSRQFGPIPESWIRGVVVARIWPIWRLAQPKRNRPQPIPLDDATLQIYNLHRIRQRQASELSTP